MLACVGRFPYGNVTGRQSATVAAWRETVWPWVVAVTKHTTAHVRLFVCLSKVESHFSVCLESPILKRALHLEGNLFLLLFLFVCLRVCAYVCLCVHVCVFPCVCVCVCVCVC